MRLDIVALTGKAGSGKSTVAKHLVARRGFTLIKMAAPLKDMIRVLGLGDDEIEGHLKEVPCDLLNGKTPRHAMQTLGTEWGRECIGHDFWLNAAMVRVLKEIKAGRRVVIDDTRFPNEVDEIMNHGGFVIRLERPTLVAGSQHASENAKTRCNHVIINDSDVHELCATVDRVLSDEETRRCRV